MREFGAYCLRCQLFLVSAAQCVRHPTEPGGHSTSSLLALTGLELYRVTAGRHRVGLCSVLHSNRWGLVCHCWASKDYSFAPDH